jgi:AcrR family transcriptional regulator
MRQDVGRVNQKRRTRAAIVAAAAALLRRGETPTVAEVADAAAVSRATAYRYFPTQAYLLSEATFERIPEEIDRVLEQALGRPSDERFDAVLHTLQERTAAQEPGFRAFLRLSLEQPFSGTTEPDAGGPLRRGARRLDWIARALAPQLDALDPVHRRRLVGALSLCMGIEALVVLRDVCGYSPEDAIDTCRWAAQTLLHAGKEAGADEC